MLCGGCAATVALGAGLRGAEARQVAGSWKDVWVDGQGERMAGPGEDGLHCESRAAALRTCSQKLDWLQILRLLPAGSLVT